MLAESANAIRGAFGRFIALKSESTLQRLALNCQNFTLLANASEHRIHLPRIRS